MNSSAPQRIDLARTSSLRTHPPPPSNENALPSSSPVHHTRQKPAQRPFPESNDLETNFEPRLHHHRRSDVGNRQSPQSPPSLRPETSQPNRRSSTRSTHAPHQHHLRPPADMVASAGLSNDAGSGPNAHASDTRHPASSAKHSRSRTTIPTQSGKWILGKTIGAGSMGKVKLARKEDGTEQVCAPSRTSLL
jgi:hypothetical protein